MQVQEQIFSRQEQAVVYLFSRYWEEIDEFKDSTIRRIHTHFPDFSISNADGKEEAIEFEYALAGFRSHLEGDCLKKLYRKEGVRRLYIVYWEENDEKVALRAQIRKKARLDVKFVCLKDSFQAEVERDVGTKELQTSWKFTGKKKRMRPSKVYSLRKIEDATNELGTAVNALDVQSQLYRVIGFNTSGSEFIECDHWEKIRFFTTTCRFARNQIPSKLLTKPTGCKYFNGYFNIQHAFEVIRASKRVKEYFADYYFYSYDQDFMNSKCFVCDFKRLEYEQGRDLYDFLIRKGYRLDVRGAIMIDETDNKKIDAIITRNSGGRNR